MAIKFKATPALIREYREQLIACMSRQAGAVPPNPGDGDELIMLAGAALSILMDECERQTQEGKDYGIEPEGTESERMFRNAAELAAAVDVCIHFARDTAMPAAEEFDSNIFDILNAEPLQYQAIFNPW